MKKHRDPLRISANKDDKAYRIDAYRFEVFLNGQPLKDVRTADEETRWAEVYTRDAEGKIVTTPDGVPVMADVFGGIEIMLRQDAYELPENRTSEDRAVKLRDVHIEIDLPDSQNPAHVLGAVIEQTFGRENLAEDFDEKIEELAAYCNEPARPRMKITGTIQAGITTSDVHIVSNTGLMTVFKTPAGFTIRAGLQGYGKDEGFNDANS